MCHTYIPFLLIILPWCMPFTSTRILTRPKCIIKKCYLLIIFKECQQELLQFVMVMTRTRKNGMQEEATTNRTTQSPRQVKIVSANLFACRQSSEHLVTGSVTDARNRERERCRRETKQEGNSSNTSSLLSSRRVSSQVPPAPPLH